MCYYPTRDICVMEHIHGFKDLKDNAEKCHKYDAMLHTMGWQGTLEEDSNKLSTDGSQILEAYEDPHDMTLIWDPKKHFHRRNQSPVQKSVHR